MQTFLNSDRGGRTNDRHDIARFSDMIVGVGSDIIRAAKIAPEIASRLLEELSRKVHDAVQEDTSARWTRTYSVDIRSDMMATLALFKLQLTAVPEDALRSARLMSLHELLSTRLVPEFSRFEALAKNATKAILMRKRAALLLDWSHQLYRIEASTVCRYMMRYNNSAAAMPADLKDLVSTFVSEAGAAWQAYLKRIRKQFWIAMCQIGAVALCLVAFLSMLYLIVL